MRGSHKVLTLDGMEKTSTTLIGNINPFRYRGYYNIYLKCYVKKIKPYLQLFKSWEKQEDKDVGFVVVKFHKDNYTVVFEEDLREHIINFTILHPLKKIIKVYFRECLYADKILKINDLLIELKQLGNTVNEQAELKAYFNFLMLNHFFEN